MIDVIAPLRPALLTLLFLFGTAGYTLHGVVWRMRTQSPPSPAVAAALVRTALPRAEVERALSDFASLGGGARVVPSFVDGRPAGLRLYAVHPASLFARAGLKNGDRVLRLNGAPLDGPDRCLAAYALLGRSDSLRIAVERAGRPLLLVVDLHD